jgi:autotransporter translocation and assembly factor TamB
MYHSGGRRSRARRPVGALDIALVLVVVLAVAALVAWIVTQAGGGHLLL